MSFAYVTRPIGHCPNCGVELTGQLQIEIEETSLGLVRIDPTTVKTDNVKLEAQVVGFVLASHDCRQKVTR